MRYVYVLRSEVDSSKRYVGITSDLKKRIKDHNSGQSAYTSKYKPWKLETYIAFSDYHRAQLFEKYLKTGSGKAFSSKRL